MFTEEVNVTCSRINKAQFKNYNIMWWENCPTSFYCEVEFAC